MGPIFRDTTELTAHHSLSEKIREAVQSSRFLIVLCSPAAKKSHWVNEEIRLFRSLHGEGSILCVLAEGTPDLSFPPALLEEGREPLAANLSGGKDGFKLGTTQLAASMLGVGLDSLIQRESKRRRQRLQIITASALVFSGVMGVTTFTAIEARDEAQESRAQAEGLVEFMITDMKDKLAPVGRLDILDSVGDRAVKYYDAQDISKLPDESLLRQARARHILGQVAIDAKQKGDAVREIEAAARLTEEVLKRNPNDSDAIFAHAQSEYYLGDLYYNLGNLDRQLKHWTHYNSLAQKLYKTDPSNIDWIMEAGYGESNLGKVFMIKKRYKDAFGHFKLAIGYYNKALEKNPDDRKALTSLANANAGAAKTAFIVENTKAALEFRTQQIEIYNDILANEPNNVWLIFRRANAQAGIVQQQLVLPNSKSYNQLVENALEGFELATRHDPKNKNWQEEYTIFRSYIEQGD